MRKIWILLCCFLLYLCLFPQTVSAEEEVAEDALIEIVFVIDCSGSMKTNDPSRMGLAMVEAFIDTIKSDGVRIGYVAYSDEISSFSELVSIEKQEKRESLRAEISAIAYFGYSDIGLGTEYAYGLLAKDNGARRMMVLISDGETALAGNSVRTVEQSNQELEDCVQKCREENIQIYTVAFGQYDGNREFLEQAAERTGAQSFSAETPESLIDILYGILMDNQHYQIRRFSNGTYAGGLQEITCVLDMPYADEINILLLSSGSVGRAAAQYGNREILFEDTGQYAVAKIGVTDNAVKEMAIQAETREKQDLQVYVISYRKLYPRLEIASEVGKNQKLIYQVFFNDRNGNAISDPGFYQTFSWELEGKVSGSTVQGMAEVKEAVISGEVLKGELSFAQSGTYKLIGTLTDSFGSYTLNANVNVVNTAPAGNIPEKDCTVLDGKRRFCLNEFFADEDGDSLSYTVLDGSGDGIDVYLDGDILTVDPKKAGNYAISIQIDDGEETIAYSYHVAVLPLWKVYWWVIALVAAALVAVILKVIHRPKPELERLTEGKKEYHFSGRMDAYFILQPESEEEIPPLSFQMNMVKEGRISLGSLFGAYPKQAAALHLEDVFLIADENRSMILYHKSKAGVMIGNAIACAQMQYNIGFGDIIYITSPEGDYDLEIHYVAVFK